MDNGLRAWSNADTLDNLSALAGNLSTQCTNYLQNMISGNTQLSRRLNLNNLVCNVNVTAPGTINIGNMRIDEVVVTLEVDVPYKRSYRTIHVKLSRRITSLNSLRD